MNPLNITGKPSKKGSVNWRHDLNQDILFLAHLLLCRLIPHVKSENSDCVLPESEKPEDQICDVLAKAQKRVSLMRK